VSAAAVDRPALTNSQFQQLSGNPGYPWYHRSQSRAHLRAVLIAELVKGLGGEQFAGAFLDAPHLY
jgi:hypothetical protein